MLIIDKKINNRRLTGEGNCAICMLPSCPKISSAPTSWSSGFSDSNKISFQESKKASGQLFSVKEKK